MRILFLSSEVAPWSKTGGLGDVAGALPAALRALGHDVLTITPRYDSIDTASLRPEPALGGSTLRLAGRAWTWSVYSDRATATLFVDVAGIFDRGHPYTDHPDEHLRWVIFQELALHICAAAEFRPSIVHCNDWQTGLVPLLARSRHPRLPDAPVLLTIHNLGYQGRFDAGTVADLDLSDPGLLHQDHLAAGWYSFLETGLLHADWISTVSPTYAAEIQTPAGGAGLDPVLRMRSDRLVGILNGIDTGEWNPRTDAHIPWRYSSRSLWRKERNKEALLGELDLAYRPNVPVMGIVSRLTSQKGWDIVPPPLRHFLDTWDVRVVVLGSGEERYRRLVDELASSHREKMRFVHGYDNRLAHLIEAGADLFLMPSLYEPCGLNQMYSLAYGTLPVVRRVGGLADTVHHVSGDHGTGFVFDHYTADGLGWAIGQGLTLHQDQAAWRAAQARAMAIDNSWAVRAHDYVALYRRMRRHERG